MKQHDDGDPAFPCLDHMGDGWYGMSLLDWFASKAPDMPQWFERQNAAAGLQTVDVMVRWRWVWAESMIAEKRRREATPGSGPTSSNGQTGGGE